MASSLVTVTEVAGPDSSMCKSKGFTSNVASVGVFEDVLSLLTAVSC